MNSITEITLLNVTRKKGKLYYLNRNGNVVEMDAATKEKTLVATPNIKKQSGYLYFLNKNGNVARVKVSNVSNRH